MAQSNEILLQPRVGCGDPAAINYDPAAVVNDTTLCIYPEDKGIVGCTDPAAANYDPKATKQCFDCCKYKAVVNVLPAVEPEPETEEPAQDLAVYAPPTEDIPQPDYTAVPQCVDFAYDNFFSGDGSINDSEGFNEYYGRLTTINPTGVNGFGGDYSVGVSGQNGSGSNIWNVFRWLFEDLGKTWFIDPITQIPWIEYHDDATSFPSGGNLFQGNQGNMLKEYCANLKREYGIESEYISIFTQDSSDPGNDVGAISACLCVNETVTSDCSFITLKGDSITTRPSIAHCVKSIDEYLTFIENATGSINIIGGVSTTFFNLELLEALGVSNPQYVFDNINNLTVEENGFTRQGIAMSMLNTALETGPGLLLPVQLDIATSTINTQNCCETAGGYWFNNTCLCEKPNNDCPTEYQTEFATLKTNPPIQIINSVQDAPRITQECCTRLNNTDRYSNVNLVWNGQYCTVSEEVIPTTDATILTLSENPINTGDCEEVIVSAYIYFNEPPNLCTGGVPTTAPVNEYRPIIDEYGNIVGQSANNVANDIEKPISEITKGEFASGFQQQVDPTSSRPTGDDTNTNCCYDTTTPILGRLIIQNETTGLATVEYIDTFNSDASVDTQQTDISTNVNTIGAGFNNWVRLTTRVSGVRNSTFNVAVEFTDGLFECCNYDIFVDDIQVNCNTVESRVIYEDFKCPGFDIRKVIDNKKSWVYNPGKASMSDSTYDEITRQGGEEALIEGYGAINRRFAPSPDAELPFRYTDYKVRNNVIERHSKLVLNSKEVHLTFNMCMDPYCGGSYLLWDGYNIESDEYIVQEDDLSRIELSPPFALNLLQLEEYKKTFQGFWLQFIEQFVPATTIFVSGEKWANCNTDICQEKGPCDYEFEATEGNGITPQVGITTPTDPTDPSQPDPPILSRLAENNNTDIQEGGKLAEAESKSKSNLYEKNIELPGLKLYSLPDDLAFRQIKRTVGYR